MPGLLFHLLASSSITPCGGVFYYTLVFYYLFVLDFSGQVYHWHILLGYLDLSFQPVVTMRVFLSWPVPL